MDTSLGLRLLPMSAVVEKVGVSRAQIYKLMNTANFPKPVHLSKRGRAWRSDEVDQWIESRSSERGQQ